MLEKVRKEENIGHFVLAKPRGKKKTVFKKLYNKGEISVFWCPINDEEYKKCLSECENFPESS